MNFNKDLLVLARKLIKLALKNNIKITVAESCTGGLLSALITSISGSSNVFECGFITYSNESKNRLLNVDDKLLKGFGAVSKEVADAMANGAVRNSNSNLSVAITGIAGPKSDDTNKAVGLVFISSFLDKNNELISKKFQFDGNRDEIRNLSVKNALNLLILQIKNAF